MGFVRNRATHLGSFALACVRARPIWLALACLVGTTARADPPPRAATAPAEIRLGDDTIFVVRATRAGNSPETRAKRSTQVLEQTLEQHDDLAVRIAVDGAMRVIYVGSTPVLQITSEDSVANGDGSLDVTAGRVATQMRAAIAHERRRAHVSRFVFDVSLSVLVGLITWLVVRRVRLLARVARIRIRTRESHGIRVGGVRLATARGTRRLLDALVVAASVLVRLTAFGAWLGFTLSLFPGTRPLRARLSHAIVVPFDSSLRAISTLAGSVFVGAAWLVALVFVLRIVGAFFRGIERGEATIAGIDRSRARALSALVRLAILTAGLAVAAQLSGGVGVFPRFFDALLLVVALGLAPTFVSAAVGVRVVFGGVLHVGDDVAIGEHRGHVMSLGLFDFTLRDADGSAVRLAYAPLLFRPIRIVAKAERPMVEGG